MSCVNVYGRYEVVKLSYSDLKLATNGFAEDLVLGKGGFGKVYRASLRSTGAVVAVKRIHAGIADGAKDNPKKQFYNEVQTLSLFEFPPPIFFI